MPRRSIGHQQVESGGNRNRFLERSREHWNHLPVSPWQRWSSRTKRIVTQDWSSPIMLPRCKSVTLQVRKLLHSHTVTGFEHYNLTLWLRMGLLNTSRLRSIMKDNFTSTKEVVATSCGPAISELLANQSAQTWALLQVRTLSIAISQRQTLEDHGLCYLQIHMWWTCWKEARMKSMERFTKSTSNNAIYSVGLTLVGRIA